MRLLRLGIGAGADFKIEKFNLTDSCWSKIWRGNLGTWFSQNPKLEFGEMSRGHTLKPQKEVLGANLWAVAGLAEATTVSLPKR